MDCIETTSGQHVVLDWLEVPGQEWVMDGERGYDTHTRGQCEACGKIIWKGEA